MVREAASFALGQFAEHLQPEILSHYASVLPCILSALEDTSDGSKGEVILCTCSFCENMGGEILPYMDPLMSCLLTSLQCSSCNLQETCMSAIGSIAAAAEHSFIPYAEDLRWKSVSYESTLMGSLAISLNYWVKVLFSTFPSLSHWFSLHAILMMDLLWILMILMTMRTLMGLEVYRLMRRLLNQEFAISALELESWVKRLQQLKP